MPKSIEFFDSLPKGGTGKILKKELRDLQHKHASPRLTQLVPDEGEINMEDLIAIEG